MTKPTKAERDQMRARADIPALLDALDQAALDAAEAQATIRGYEEAAKLAGAQMAAMRRALERIVRHEELAQKELIDAGLGLTVLPWMEQAVAALQPDAGSALLAEHKAEVERLRGVLRSLISEQLGPDAWGIKCIEDHNAIIREALGDDQ